MKKFCVHCLKEVNCKFEEKKKEFFVDNNKLSFLEKYYICDECNNKFYDDLFDYNISKGHEVIRNKYDKLNNSFK